MNEFSFKNGSDTVVEHDSKEKEEYQNDLTDIGMYVSKLWDDNCVEQQIVDNGFAVINSSVIHTEKIDEKRARKIKDYVNSGTAISEEACKSVGDMLIYSTILTEDFKVPGSYFCVENTFRNYLREKGYRYDIFRQYKKGEGIIGYFRNWFFWLWDYSYVLFISYDKSMK